MAEVPKIDGMERLQRKIKANIRKMQQQNAKSVIVGYTAAYARAVHERVEMKWKGLPRNRSLWSQSGHSAPWIQLSEAAKKIRGKARKRGYFWDPQGKAQAKFLEEPARRLRPELRRIVRQVFDKTKNIEKALIAAGLRLIRESTQLVPVDTGNLKASWFCRVIDKHGGGRTIAKGAKSRR